MGEKRTRTSLRVKRMQRLRHWVSCRFHKARYDHICRVNAHAAYLDRQAMRRSISHCIRAGILTTEQARQEIAALGLNPHRPDHSLARFWLP